MEVSKLLRSTEHYVGGRGYGNGVGGMDDVGFGSIGSPSGGRLLSQVLFWGVVRVALAIPAQGRVGS